MAYNITKLPQILVSLMLGALLMPQQAHALEPMKLNPPKLEVKQKAQQTTTQSKAAKAPEQKLAPMRLKPPQEAAATKPVPAQKAQQASPSRQPKVAEPANDNSLHSPLPLKEEVAKQKQAPEKPTKTAEPKPQKSEQRPKVSKGFANKPKGRTGVRVETNKVAEESAVAPIKTSATPKVDKADDQLAKTATQLTQPDIPAKPESYPVDMAYIGFADNGHKLGTHYRAHLDSLAQELKNNKRVQLEVRGYAPYSTNMNIRRDALIRATVVRNYLIAAGLQEHQIETYTSLTDNTDKIAKKQVNVIRRR